MPMVMSSAWRLGNSALVISAITGFGVDRRGADFAQSSPMDLERITGLKADIVPHRQWPVSKWFYANELWYYHRLGTDEEVVAGRKFYRLVDEDFRERCHMLNAAGLLTKRECHGHFYEKKRFEFIWVE